MTASVLVSGSLFRAPEQKTSKSGKPFVTATIKVKDGEAVAWWKILAFSDSVCAELLRLGDGDALAAQGTLKAETYERNGETKLSLTIFADAVLALRQPAKQREAKAPPPPDTRTRAERIAGIADPDFDDRIPF